MRHLLGGFISAAYRPSRSEQEHVVQPWTAQRAEGPLVFLAHHLERTIKGADFAWWQLTSAAPAVVPVTKGLAAGLACGLLGDLLGGPAVGISAGISSVLVTMGVAGTFATINALMKDAERNREAAFALGAMIVQVLSGICVVAVVITGVLVSTIVGGLAGRIAIGAMGGLVGGIAAGVGSIDRDEQSPSDPVRWRLSRRALAAGLVFGLVIGLVCGLAVSHRFGLIFGIIGGLLAGIAAGLEGVPGDLSTAAAPSASLLRNRRTALLTTLTVGLPIGLLAGLATWLADRSGYGLAVGVVVGLIGWLIFGPIATKASWLEWEVARSWLALRRRLPWRLMAFLHDAHDRGVLWQSGSVYQYRHLELQRWLAARWTDGRRAREVTESD